MQEQITSGQNPRIKNLIKLKKENRRKKEGVVLIEGEKEISMALLGGIKINELYYCDEFGDKGDILKQVKGKNIFRVSQEVFQKISVRENPDGLIALAEAVDKRLKDIKLSKNPLIVAIESVEKTGNLGAIVRSADAAGADALVMIDPLINQYNPNTIRASRGTIFTFPVVVCSCDDFFEWTQKNKIAVMAATPHTDRFYTDVNFKKPSAIFFGTEHEGLSGEVLNKADSKIKIPMNGKIDSLNVSASVAVMLFEAIRQRK